jgi:hypothetical protein
MDWWKEKKRAAAEWMTWSSRTGRQLSNAWWKISDCCSQKFASFCF